MFTGEFAGKSRDCGLEPTVSRGGRILAKMSWLNLGSLVTGKQLLVVVIVGDRESLPIMFSSFLVPLLIAHLRA